MDGAGIVPFSSLSVMAGSRSAMTESGRSPLTNTLPRVPRPAPA